MKVGAGPSGGKGVNLSHGRVQRPTLSRSRFGVRRRVLYRRDVATPEGVRAVTDVKYPDVEVKLIGEDGNAFAVLGAVQRALRDAGIPRDEVEEFVAEATSGDYDHLLEVVLATVEVS
jgi:hypothetical protein